MSYKPVFGAVCYYEFKGDLIDFIQEVETLGLKWIEYKYDKSLSAKGRSADTVLIRRAVADAGLGLSIHTPFDGLNIAAVDEGYRIKSVDEIKRSLDYAAEIGAAQATIHSGQMATDTFTPESWDISVKNNIVSLQELVQYGKETGVNICLENGNAYEKEWLKHGNNHSEMNFIHSRMTDDLYFTIDFGHALYLSRDPSFLIREMGPENILMTHLHDNNGLFDSHSDLGTGILAFDALMNTMYRDQWSFPVCLEMKSDESLKNSAKKLKEFHA